jgi:Xaa-Pro aminopeptidase
MKRGLITWDKTEQPPEAFEARLAAARGALAAQDLPALVVYSDLWKSNHARFFSNFMPYFNRGLLIIPRESKPVLLCGLSPRVYPWIKSVTILEEILPSPNLAQRLLQVCSEKDWKRIGVLDLDQLPYDLHTPVCAGVECVDVPSRSIRPVPDQWELAMYRRAANMAREILREEVPAGVGLIDYEFVSRLERKLRLAGAEDLVILVTNGETPPMPATGAKLGAEFSVSLALEYRGHWVKVIRNAAGLAPEGILADDLSGPYPYELGEAGSLFASRAEVQVAGRRLFFGDTNI